MDENQTEFDEVSQDAVCSLTHFVCTNQPLSMVSESPSNIDLDDPNTDFDEHYLSALFVQVNNSKKAHKT